jgi:chromosome segregation ATPase
MNNKVIINNENDIKLKNNNLKEVSKNEAMNGGIKNKDIDLTNALNKMNLLKKENEDLKKKIYQIENSYNSNHNNNPNYEDSTQKNLEKIKLLQTEKRLIEKHLIEHNKCIEEQNLINKEYNNLKNELRSLKINNQEIKSKIKEFEKKILNFEINDINNSNYINNNINSLLIKKKNNYNAANRRTPSIRNTTFSKTLPKVQNKNLLPIISIQPLIPNISNYSNNKQNNSILSEEFIKKIKKFFNDNESEYFNLIEKINNIENNLSIDNNYTKLKKYNTQIGIIDNISVLNLEGKENEEGLKMMNHKLNLLKDENFQQNKKLEELNKHLDNIKNIEKEKENEINALLNKINSMKINLKFDN